MAEVLPSETAEEWKNAGNDFYKAKNYSGAATAYSKAIDLDPTNALLFTNRAAAYLMSLLYKEALTDCNSAIKLDGSCSKAYFRKATALKGLGRLDAAIDALSRGLEYDPASVTAQKEKDTLVKSKEKIGNIRTLMSQKQYSAAMRQCDVLIKDIGAAFPEITLLRAECLLNLSRPEEAFNLSNVLMKAGQAGDVSLLSLRARCLVMMGDLDNAFRHLQTAVRSDPDNTTIRAFYRSLRDIVDGKNSGDDSFKRQSYDDAVRSYSQALDSFKALGVKCKEFEAKIYLNRATSYHKIRRNEDGLKDCNMAISLKDDYVKAYIRRAECFQALGGPDNIERAISDLEKARELETEEEAQSSLEHKIKKAKVLLKRSKRKDLYAILGVTPDASDAEIKSAYRKAALRYHPDKQSSKSDAEKAEAETKFKEVGEAYEILTNPEKKARYDEGVDLEDLDNPHAGGSAGGYGGEMDPNMLFHMFMQQQQQQRGRGGRGGFGGFNDY